MIVYWASWGFIVLSLSLSPPNRQQRQLKGLSWTDSTKPRTNFFLIFLDFFCFVFVEHVHSLIGRWFSLSNVTAGSGIDSKSTKYSKKFLIKVIIKKYLWCLYVCMFVCIFHSFLLCELCDLNVAFTHNI